MANVLRAGQITVLSPEMIELFGSDVDPINAVTARAEALYSESTPIVWECDACSFQFAYVSDAAAGLLGYPVKRWLEPGFWAGQVVLDDDREDAVAYCTLATAKARDHMFEYRARAADGRIVWLRDFVKVILGPESTATRLRGVMFDVTVEKAAHPEVPPARMPARAALAAS